MLAESATVGVGKLSVEAPGRGRQCEAIDVYALELPYGETADVVVSPPGTANAAIDKSDYQGQVPIRYPRHHQLSDDATSPACFPQLMQETTQIYPSSH